MSLIRLSLLTFGILTCRAYVTASSDKINIKFDFTSASNKAKNDKQKE
jgi:hypothetical protein